MYKILIISFWKWGTHTFIFNSIEGLRDARHEIKFLFHHNVSREFDTETIDDGFGESINVSNTDYIKYLVLKIRGSCSKGLNEFFDLYANWPKNGRAAGAAQAWRWYRILRKLSRWRPDLLHVHFATNLPYILPIARFLNVPVVCTVHGGDIYRNNNWRDAFSSVPLKRVVCVSDSLRTYIELTSPELAPKLIRVFNPIGRVFLDDVADPPHSMRIVSVAASRTIKNHAWLLKSLRTLAQRGIEFECTLISGPYPGEPHVYEELLTFVDRYALGERVHFLGLQCPSRIKQEIDQFAVANDEQMNI